MWQVIHYTAAYGSESFRWYVVRGSPEAAQKSNPGLRITHQ